jgi:hypothetical protein
MKDIACERFPQRDSFEFTRNNLDGDHGIDAEARRKRRGICNKKVLNLPRLPVRIYGSVLVFYAHPEARVRFAHMCTDGITKPASAHLMRRENQCAVGLDSLCSDRL